MSRANAPSPAALAAELGGLLRSGVTTEGLRSCQAASSLALARAKSASGEAADLAVAVHTLITEAAKRVDDGAFGPAATLLGLAPGTRGSLLKERRRQAAEELHVSAEHLRKEREPLLIEAVADELYAADSAYRLRHRHRMSAEREPEHSGLGVDWLAQHRSYRRIWTPLAGLRDDLLVLRGYLAGEIPTIQVTGLDRHIDHNVSDGELDELLRNADLIVASTDDREAQRRVNACARRLDVTVVSPGLYENDGGEVFIQQDAQDAELPCFSCWDEFRLADAALRGVSALNVDILPVLALTVELCLGVLDWSSVYARHLAPRSDGQLPILFRLTVRDDLVLGIATLDKRSECPVCGQQSSAGPAMWQPSGSRTTSQFLLPAWFDDTDSIPLRLLALVGSIAFAVCPFLIMTHLFQGAGVLQLIIGPVCFVWVFAGLAAVVTTAWAVLGISVESLGRMTRHRSWRGVAVILTLCAMTVLLFRAASTPFSADESTRSAPAGTELAVLERIAKGERISDESVDNKDAMIEAAVKLEPSRWFKPCRFGTPVTAATPVKTYKCVTNGVSSTLEYFAEPNEVQRALLKRAWEVGAVRPKATCPDDAPALQEYGLGYVLCFIKHEHLYYAWTNSTGYEVRYTEARFPGFDPGAAQQWWNEANVEVSAHWIPRY